MIVDHTGQVELLVCSLTGRWLSAWSAGNVEGLDALLEARADTTAHLVRFLKVGLRRCILVMHMVPYTPTSDILLGHVDRLLLSHGIWDLSITIWHDLLVIRRG